MESRAIPKICKKKICINSQASNVVTANSSLCNKINLVWITGVETRWLHQMFVAREVINYQGP